MLVFPVVFLARRRLTQSTVARAVASRENVESEDEWKLKISGMGNPFLRLPLTAHSAHDLQEWDSEGQHLYLG